MSELQATKLVAIDGAILTYRVIVTIDDVAAQRAKALSEFIETLSETEEERLTVAGVKFLRDRGES